MRPTHDELAEAYSTLLLVDDDPIRKGLDDTPARAARAWDELTCGYCVDVDGLFTTFDAEGYDEMIAVIDIPFASLCEHHLLPFIGRAHVVYLPADRVVGLSKIPRLVNAYARRLQLQERLTAQIADALERKLEPRGVMVRIDAEHACTTLRGVRTHGSTMRTSVTRGAMRKSAASRAEALGLIAA